MKFRIPFTFSDIDKLKRRSSFISQRIKRKKNSKLKEELESAGIDITREEYIGVCLRNLIIIFIFTFVVATSFFAVANQKIFYILGPGVALVISSFLFFMQIMFPKLYITKKQKDIERNLLYALEDILIQLNSGVPLFDILRNISYANYGVLSDEFKKAVHRINSGEPEVAVLADIGKRNPSVFLKRTLWQISNGLNAGSDMSLIVRDSIKTLNEEQLIQIQSYGNKLNPLIMFYMLLSVIVPSLSVTFLTILASMAGMNKQITIGAFAGLFCFVVLFQIMFLGLIKSRRPSLLS
ncbi:hypothetical protein GOV14_05735 [Candidatus Pacearchaeota archaeon]|nr:hypothetical protein [Candidatus Pacearchaeota archaeon]